MFLVEPSYVGMLSDLEAITGIAHGAGVPVIVDQAWGAHLGFHPALPPHAIARGADAMVTSTHKTLTAFTQGSVVLARGGLLDLARVEEAFELLHTTSPSAQILASSDSARRLVEVRGEELLGQACELAAGARARLRWIDGLHVSEASDPVKLVLGLAGTGADGFQVEADLLTEGVRLEMADRDTLVPIVTLADTPETVDRLVEALERSVALRRGPARPLAASSVWSLEPVAALSPREAFFAPRERVAAEACGRPHRGRDGGALPAGIPALAPGELITEPILEALQREARAGTRVAYCSDPTLETLLVVANRS